MRYIDHLVSAMLTLKLGLPERRSVAGDDDELGLAGAESLQGGLVAQSDLAGLYATVSRDIVAHGTTLERTLIVSASLALMLSEVLVDFFGAILLVVIPDVDVFGRRWVW